MTLTSQIPRNDPVHVSFDRTGVVLEGQSGGDGIEITAQTRSEGPQGR